MAIHNKSPRDKRNRERGLKERAQEKEEKRAQRKEIKKSRLENIQDGVDPDLVGIVPGPQPRED